ncbi:PQQ-dependent catabolism-associated CXXCW motif protein [Marinivivus vitaminiproducens]|uniref:PQQ-dependent catabolism-associated CXXCW motif protein n=1 Tax=Marinivivus vitaminiproducens TaxID=3035935 RepID=UPI00279838F0|nr:PQQ-dependent catabolism-associated CXXCW motif protein [Geminicoccaceae bacterium SCSIO 64248]
MRPIQICLVVLALMGTGPSRAETVPEPQGYREDGYRAPTPATLAGATVLDGKALLDLITHEPVVLIDTMPEPPRPPDLKPGVYWQAPRRSNIPGSVWLANTGYGVLSEEMAAYFDASLERLSLGDPGRKLVFYCEPNCWMSWNAAKRAITLGYEQVYWYPGGAEGWRAEGHALMPTAPIPVD